MSSLRLVQNQENKMENLYIDSLEVAEMTGKRHAHLLRDIDKYVDVLSLNPILGLANFFIESSYQDSTGKINKSYLLTRKGCDMVANKMTGEKGILFTATYVTRFEEMENELKSQTPQFKLPTTYKDALIQLVSEIEAKEEAQLAIAQKNEYIEEIQPHADNGLDFIDKKGSLNATQVLSKLREQGICPPYIRSTQGLNAFLNEQQVQYKKGSSWTVYSVYNGAHPDYKGKNLMDEGLCITTQNDTGKFFANQMRWTLKGYRFIVDLIEKDLKVYEVYKNLNN